MQRIDNHILFPTIMLARESEGLKELNQLSMPSVQLVLTIDERQSLVI